MIATYVQRSDSTKADRRIHESIPFLATCPKCKQPQPQHGYNRATLSRLLERGYPVEAYCSVCEEFWAISAHERARLVTWLGLAPTVV
jgi:hypothetical protein